MLLMRFNNRIFYILFCFIADFKQVLMFTIEIVFNKYCKKSVYRFLYFENCLRKETEISVETNFRSFVFI